MNTRLRQCLPVEAELYRYHMPLNTEYPITPKETTAMQTISTGNGAQSTPADVYALPAIDPAAAPFANRRTAPPMDFWHRLRDRLGNRLAWGYAYSTPAVTGTPIEQTALAPALRVIEGEAPLMAAEIRDNHDRKLLPAYGNHRDVVRHEHAELEAQRAQALAINADVEAERLRWEAEREKAVAPHVPALRRIEDELLPQAHLDAASAASSVGGVYLPKDPSEACVLRHERRPLEAVAAELRLPWAPGDVKDIAVSPMGWLSLIGVGTLLGISLGVAVHALTSYTLATRWPVTLGCAALGITLTYAMKQAVRGAWRHVGQNYYSRQSRRKWATSLGAALLRTLGLLVVEVCRERQGLLATVQISHAIMGLSGGSSALSAADQVASWVIPMVISSALMLWAADQGYLEGRHHEALCRLAERQDEIWREEDAARRGDPGVQRALDAIARVRDLVRRHELQKGRIAEAAAPLEARIAEVTARKVAVPEGLSTEAKHRIQDSRDDYLGAQAEFNRLWEQARWEIEPTGARWSRFWRALFGFRRGRQRSREKRLR